MQRIIILGCGLVGRTIAMDLAQKYQVTAVDINSEKLTDENNDDNLFFQQADLTDIKVLKDIILDYDLVVGAVPGYLGFQTLKTVIEAGKNIVDISFFPENAFELNELATQNNVTAIVDCGVAPGLSNLICGYHAAHMEMSSFKCYVGGLPKEKIEPFFYKAPFSPVDVLEEYIRPARFKQENVIVTKEALSDLEILNFDKVGELEAFNTDGLRSLLQTIDCPNMIEKTLRYPGHVDKIKTLMLAGFFSNEPLNIGKESFSPLQLTSKILFDQWTLKPTDEEFTILTVEIEGNENGKKETYKYELYDEYDASKQNSSMARTTGFTCNAIADLVLQGKIAAKGVLAPEQIANEEGVFKGILDYLKARNVNLNCSTNNNQLLA